MMMTLTKKVVYRIEDRRNGEGPYRTDRFSFQSCYEHNWEKHPTPSSDGRKARPIYDEEQCGFKSLSHARQWFGHWGKDAIDFLEEQGFVLSVYKVPADYVHELDHQCLFTKYNALLVKQIPLSKAIRA
jgi:hypothetical protein